MHQGLVSEIRSDKNGVKKLKWVRPIGTKPLSTASSHRRKYVSGLRLKCLFILGSKCVACGFDKDVRALHIDHVNSDGYKEKKLFSGGSYYHNILKNIESGRYQILCANCNYIKRIEKQECPLKG